VLGTHVHGLLDGAIGNSLARTLLQKKGVATVHLEQPTESTYTYHQRQFDLLADALRQNLNLTEIRRLMGIESRGTGRR
jgi:cobyric acid synthase